MTGPTADESLTPLPDDDCVITFRTEKSGIRGRLVRLGSAVDSILTRHRLPEYVAGALGEALSLVSILGSALAGEGKIILQTRTDGVVSLLVADYAAKAAGAGDLRGYARFDANTLTDYLDSGDVPERGDVLGEGTLAITMEQGEAAERYQAVTAIDRVSLAEAAAAYFEEREALPVFVNLAVAKLYSSGKGDAPPMQCWRAGGLMMQHDRYAPHVEDDSGEADTDSWARVRMLAGTIEDHEILDPMLSPERLLLRLFHEEGVRIERVTRLGAQCRCSRERVSSVLKSFGADEIAKMRDADDRITVTCEFCATSYHFGPTDLADD